MGENIIINKSNNEKSDKARGERSRIAIFQYKSPLGTYTRNLIFSLAEAGYIVEVFFDHSCLYDNLVEIESLKTKKNIVFYEFEQNCTLFLFDIRRIWRGLVRKLFNKYSPLKEATLKNSKEIIKKHVSDYLCFIGIEKKGIIWAGKLSETTGIPFFYYSLELYVEDHPGYNVYNQDRKQEIYYHQRAKATIVQDDLRANVLYKYNRIEKQDRILLPVSIKGKSSTIKSDYLRKKYRLPKEIKILLYFGNIGEFRNCSLIANIAEQMNGYVVIFHGYGENDYLEELAKRKNVIVSSDLVSEDQIKNVISSADIGLTLYCNTFSNDRLTAFSSEKVALCLQFGIPIIAMNNESYEALFGKFKCGEMVDNINEFPEAVNKITSNIEEYKHLANIAYNEFYDHDKNIKVLLKYLERLKV